MACRCVLCVHRVPALRPEASATVDALVYSRVSLLFRALASQYITAALELPRGIERMRSPVRSSS